MKTTATIILYLVSLILLSCEKPGNDPSPNPPVMEKDTLGDWQKIDAKGRVYFDVWFLNAKDGFLSGPEGLYASNDSGKTWATTNVTGFFENLFFLNAQVGYALGHADMAYTLDAGKTWIKKPLGLSLDDYAQNGYFVSPSTGFMTSKRGLFKTTDTGNTWTRKLNLETNGIFFKNATTGWVESGAIWKTVDGGETWQQLSNTFTSPQNTFNTLQFIDDQHAWITSFPFIGRSTDGGVTWTKKDFPIASSNYDLHFFNSESGIVSSQAALHKTQNGGLSWTKELSIKEGSIVEIFFLDENTGWACGDRTILRLKK